MVIQLVSKFDAFYNISAALLIRLLTVVGFLPPLMSVTFVRVVSFSTYQAVKYRISDEFERITGVSPLAYYNQTGSLPSLATITTFTVAGMCAGLAASPFACKWAFLTSESKNEGLFLN